VLPGQTTVWHVEDQAVVSVSAASVSAIWWWHTTTRRSDIAENTASATTTSATITRKCSVEVRGSYLFCPPTSTVVE